MISRKMTTSSWVFSLTGVRRLSSSARIALKTKPLAKLWNLGRIINIKFIFIILWQTRKIKSLFNDKDKNVHKSNLVYHGECACGTHYLGETVEKCESLNTQTLLMTLNISDILVKNPSHSFSGELFFSTTFHKRRIVEGLMIQQRYPRQQLSEQTSSFICFETFPIENELKYEQCDAGGHLTPMKTLNSKAFIPFMFKIIYSTHFQAIWEIRLKL